jgi:hypothetical protein
MCDVSEKSSCPLFRRLSGLCTAPPKSSVFVEGDQSATPGKKSLFRRSITVVSTNTLPAAITFTKVQTTENGCLFLFPLRNARKLIPDVYCSFALACVEKRHRRELADPRFAAGSSARDQLRDLMFAEWR